MSATDTGAHGSPGAAPCLVGWRWESCRRPCLSQIVPVNAGKERVSLHAERSVKTCGRHGHGNRLSPHLQLRESLFSGTNALVRDLQQKVLYEAASIR
eukprot:scaffold5770_cov388-Prasinococcus_capsulatus_cf.AAC.4